MDLHLRDQHILITGGSKGIGLACAQAFLAEGARVTLISRDATNLARAREQLAAHDAARIHTHAADLRDANAALAALDAAEAALGPVDVLVNSAGAAKRTPAPELTPQAWQDAMLREQPAAGAQCDTVALQRNVEFGRKHKINGTPTLITADGNRVPGAINTAQIEKLLADASK